MKAKATYIWAKSVCHCDLWSIWTKISRMLFAKTRPLLASINHVTDLYVFWLGHSVHALCTIPNSMKKSLPVFSNSEHFWKWFDLIISCLCIFSPNVFQWEKHLLELRRIMALRHTYSSRCNFSSLNLDVAARSISKISTNPCTQLLSSLPKQNGMDKSRKLTSPHLKHETGP